MAKKRKENNYLVSFVDFRNGMISGNNFGYIRICDDSNLKGFELLNHIERRISEQQQGVSFTILAISKLP